MKRNSYSNWVDQLFWIFIIIKKLSLIVIIIKLGPNITSVSSSDYWINTQPLFSKDRKINKIWELKKEFQSRINRNLIFFCPHMNRQPGLFKLRIISLEFQHLFWRIDIFERTKEVHDIAVNSFINLVFTKKKPNATQLEHLKPIVQRIFINYKKVNMGALISHHSSLPSDYPQLKRKVLESCTFYSKKLKEGIVLFEGKFCLHNNI